MAAIATTQFGVVSAGQLYELGYDRHWIRRQLAARWLHALYRGVYAVGHISVSRRGRFMAAVLACGPGAALSHRAGGEHWSLRDPGSGRIEVTVPHASSGSPDLLVHRTRMLHPDDFTRRDGISVTSVPRTLLDLAGMLTRRQLARAVDRAERQDLFDLTSVQAVLSRARGRRGAAALRSAIAAWQPSHTRSELEDRFYELVEAAGLPHPVLNSLLQGERDLHEVDALWPAHRLVVELDGFTYHRTRRDHERDADRNADVELGGYRVIRLTWDDVTRHRNRTSRRLHNLIRSDT